MIVQQPYSKSIVLNNGTTCHDAQVFGFQAGSIRMRNQGTVPIFMRLQGEQQNSTGLNSTGNQAVLGATSTGWTPATTGDYSVGTTETFFIDHQIGFQGVDLYCTSTGAGGQTIAIFAAG